MNYNNDEKTPVTLGCYMIVKNEEQSLKKCLDSICALCDEIAVVDTGSSDKTIEIASQYDNVKIYHFDWINDFSAARNFAMGKVSHMNYSFTTDADEEFSPQLKDTIKNLKNNGFLDYDCVDIWLYNQNSENNGTYYLGGRQIVKNYSDNIWKYKVHEKLYCRRNKRLTINRNNGLIFHRHVGDNNSTSNYNKYTEVYFDEFNSNKFTDLSYGTHFFYYMFFTMKDFDRFAAITHLPYGFDEHRFLMDNEDIRISLWLDRHISAEEFVVCEALVRDKCPKLFKDMSQHFSEDTSKYLATKYLYENGHKDLIEFSRYFDFALMSYSNGFMRDFEEISKDTVKLFGNYGPQKHNVEFFDAYIKPVLENLPLVIDCNHGTEHLPSLIYYYSKMFDNIIILSEKNITNKFSFDVIKNVRFETDESNISGKRCTITANKLVNIKDAVREYENIMYGNPTSFIEVKEK